MTRDKSKPMSLARSFAQLRNLLLRKHGNMVTKTINNGSIRPHEIPQPTKNESSMESVSVRV